MTTSAVLKKELKQAFPGIKFSVTTRKSSDDISVSWELTIGTTATKNAVSEICKRYETIEHHGDVQNDTSWFSGFSVDISPTSTKERKDWAVKATEAHNFVGATWNGARQHFQEVDGRDAFHATKQYYEYRDNGVSSTLVDKYGQEPNTKRWYYERLVKEAQAKSLITELETVKPELIDSPKETIIPISIQSINPPISIRSNFPSDIKKRCIDEYCNQKERLGKAKVTKLIELTPEDYQKFTHSLLDCHLWLVEEGGNNRSDYYSVCVMVTDCRDYILIDPQGLNYARCVGFGADKTLTEVLNFAQVQLSTISDTPITVAQPKTLKLEAETIKPELVDVAQETVLIAATQLSTNLIPFPTPKQPEAQSVPQPQSQDSDYVQIYQKWVDKLVARGEYSKIKSYDEWYAIASEVM